MRFTSTVLVRRKSNSVNESGTNGRRMAYRLFHRRLLRDNRRTWLNPHNVVTGAELSHSSIVRDCRVVAHSDKESEVELSRPDNFKLEHLQIIAFLQTPATAEVISAVATELK
jgi:hypothetical protein